MNVFARPLAFALMGCGMLAASTAQAQCYAYGYRQHSYVAPSYVYQYPYTYADNSFNVTYRINFPAPALTGSTIYGNTQPYGFSQLDPLEAYRLRVSAGQRGIELGAQIVQSADVTFTQVGAAAEQQAKLQLLDKIDRLLNSAPTATSSVIQSRVSRDATGQVRIEGVTSAGSADVQAITTAKCVSCHGGGKTEKGLDLRNLAAVDDSYEPIILRKILTDDPADHMPPPGSGIRLTVEEKLAYLKVSRVCGNGKPAGTASPAAKPIPANPDIPPAQAPRPNDSMKR